MLVFQNNPNTTPLYKQHLQMHNEDHLIVVYNCDKQSFANRWVLVDLLVF